MEARHVAGFRKALKLLDRFIHALDPPNKTSTKLQIKMWFGEAIDLIRSTISSSLIFNQLIQIPGLFSYDPFNSRERPLYVSDSPHDPEAARNKLLASASELKPHEFIRLVYPDSWKSRHRLILLCFSGVAGSLYGGIHAVKWNSHFPSVVEHRMWQVSCCMGLLGILPVVAFGLPGFSISWWASERHEKLRWWFNAFCYTSGTVMTVCFLFARTYLVVGSFLALRSMPASVYQTVKWLDFWKGGLSIGQQ